MRIDRKNTGTIGVLFISAVLALLNMSCASSGSVAEGTDPTGRLFDQGEVDSPARLLACGGYQRATSRGVLVSVSFVVNSDGTVDQPSVVRAKGITSAYREQASEQALALAQRCVFEPARIDGQPVAVRSGTSFRIEPFPG